MGTSMQLHRPPPAVMGHVAARGGRAVPGTLPGKWGSVPVLRARASTLSDCVVYGIYKDK